MIDILTYTCVFISIVADHCKPIRVGKKITKLGVSQATNFRHPLDVEDVESLEIDDLSIIGHTFNA